MVKRKKRSWDSQIFTKVKTIALDDITADLSMQQRAESYDEIISEYAEILRSGGELAPLKVIRDENNTLWLWDGFHTLEAAKRAGKEKIKAEILRGTQREAWLKSLGANETHGIRRSRADRQKAVDGALNDPEIKLSLLEDDGEHSFRSIAKLCAVGHQMVSRRWNNIHYPKILAEINETVRQEPMPDHQDNKEWFAQIAQELSVPTWLVKKQYAEQQALLAAQKETSEADLTGGPSPTHQTEATRTIDPAEPETSEADLTSGPSPTHQTEATRTIDPAEPETSEADLTSGPSSTHQTEATRTIEPAESETSEADLTSGPSSTHQTVSARNDDTQTTEPASIPTVEIITTGMPARLTPESALPANIAVHHPTQAQHYSGQEAVQLLTGYMNKQIGVKVVEARRPEGGWSGKVGKEIGQALSQITDTGIENIGSILIVVVQK